jgi:hypothetical protein
MTMQDKRAKPKYVIGQKVIIQPVGEQGATQRENEINKYAGEVGEVSNYYWINPRNSQIFYMYNVQVGEHKKEIAVYEDEIEPCLS